VRRLVRPDVRKLSFLDDWFALVLLLAIVGLGNVQTLVLHPNYMETVSPWLQNVLLGNPVAGVEKMAEALLEEMERLHEKMRSGDRKVLGWYRDVAARYQRLVDISLALDIEPSIMGRLRDKWKEVSLEAGRLR